MTIVCKLTQQEILPRFIPVIIRSPDARFEPALTQDTADHLFVERQFKGVRHEGDEQARYPSNLWYQSIQHAGIHERGHVDSLMLTRFSWNEHRWVSSKIEIRCSS